MTQPLQPLRRLPNLQGCETQPGGHQEVALDAEARECLATWMDTHAQRTGAFSPEQEQELERSRRVSAGLLMERTPPQTAARRKE